MASLQCQPIVATKATTTSKITVGDPASRCENGAYLFQGMISERHGCMCLQLQRCGLEVNRTQRQEFMHASNGNLWRVRTWFWTRELMVRPSYLR